MGPLEWNRCKRLHDGGMDGGKGLRDWGKDTSPTWERIRDGRHEMSRIDFFISRGLKTWTGEKKEKLTSDHWALHTDIDWSGENSESEVLREKIDCDLLWKEVARGEEEEGNGDSRGSKDWKGALRMRN